MDDVMDWSKTHLANELNKAGKRKQHIFFRLSVSQSVLMQHKSC